MFSTDALGRGHASIVSVVNLSVVLSLSPLSFHPGRSDYERTNTLLEALGTTGCIPCHSVRRSHEANHDDDVSEMRRGASRIDLPGTGVWF